MAEPTITGAPTFESVLEAAKRRLRLQQGEAQSRIAQNVKTSGVRTSGVGQIPLLAADRARQVGEAGLTADLGNTRLGQIGQLEAINLQGSIQERLARMGYEHERDIARTRGREALQNALIGGGAAIAGGFAGGPVGSGLASAAAKKLAAKKATQGDPYHPGNFLQ